MENMLEKTQSVSFSDNGNTVVIGALWNYDNGSYAGLVCVYKCNNASGK